MYTTIVKFGLLSLMLFNFSSFAQTHRQLSFTAAEFTNNYTRANLESYKRISYSNPADCYGVAVDLIGTTGILKGTATGNVIRKEDKLEISTAEAIKGFDQIAYTLQIGNFREWRNSNDYPIPDCAYYVAYTLSD